MKRKLFTMVAGIFLLAGTSMAQESGFGAKAGLNLNNMRIDIDGESVDTEMRMGFHIGGMYNMLISDAFGLQFELVFSSQGYKTPSSTETISSGIPGVPDITVETPETIVRMNYINIPILAKYYFTESLNVVAGPQFGIYAGGKAEVDGESEDLEDVSALDVSLGFGLQYELEAGLGFGARYNLGMTNTYDGEFDEFTAKQGVIQISVGYQF